MNSLGAMRLLGSYGETPTEGRLFAELGRAIDTTGLSVHFQPEVEMRSGRVTVVEALVRWRHPRRGFLPPAAFVPVAEGSPLMAPLTLRVLAEALRRLRQWDLDGVGAADVAVAVNVSASTLTDALFARRVLRALELSSIEPSRLELEITEHELPVDPAAVRAGVRPLVEAGVRLSIDDFGTGYSSLSRLTALPVSKVKIDRSFVSGLGVDRNADVIVASTIELGRNLGLQVVAEGVETDAQYRRLLELGCDFAQGFYVCPPVHALRFVRWTGLRDSLPIADVKPRPAAPSRRPGRVRRSAVMGSVAVLASAATLTTAAAFPGGADGVLGAVRSALGRPEVATAAPPLVVPIPVPVEGVGSAMPPVDDVELEALDPGAGEPAPSGFALPPDAAPSPDVRVTDVLAEVVQRTRAVAERVRSKRSTEEQPPPSSEQEPPPPEEQPPAEEAPPAEPAPEDPPPQDSQPES